MNYQNITLPAGLYLVGTPIGNARDITLRALDVLACADVLAAEDTRTACKLLEIHGIPLNGRKIIAYHDHNGNRARPGLMALLEQGKSIAYVSEAGMPLIADPGYDLSIEAQHKGYLVTTAPGPTALTTALAIGGMPTDRVLFAGFAPAQAPARRRFLTELKQVPATIACYESPARIGDFVTDIREVFGADHPISICRELTKKFEEVLRGSVSDVQERIEKQPLRGEIVVLIGVAGAAKMDEDDIKTALVNAMLTMRVKDASDSIAGLYNLPRRDVYQMALSIKEKNNE